MDPQQHEILAEGPPSTSRIPLFLLARDANGSLSVELGGSSWSLITFDLDESETPSDIPFTCISYSWGTDRSPNPFHPSSPISSHTLPALLASTTHRPSTNFFWIDALCLPHTPQAKTQTLQSMGYIYSRASEVIAVLSPPSLPALLQMSSTSSSSSSTTLLPSHLAALESDQWVSRAWTYQEAVNARRLSITCSAPSSPLIAGDTFMNTLGYTLSRPETGSGLEKLRRYPRLDAFEEVVGDYLSAGYGERSALQVMGNMDRRTASRGEDRFYAMMGAVSRDRPGNAEGRGAGEVFMGVCERKGDWSFVYSDAKREEGEWRRWRPSAEGEMRAVLPWYCFGEGQRGHFGEEGGFWLDGMAVLGVEEIEEGSRARVEGWLGNSGFFADGIEGTASERAFTALGVMGFRGSERCFETKSGFFFPCEHVPAEVGLEILVTTGVKWSFGAPGFARFKQRDAEFYVPGAFFGHTAGRVDGEGTTSVRVS